MEAGLEGVDALVVGGGDGDDFAFAEAALEGLEIIGGAGEVHFIGDDEPGSFGEGGIVEFEFLAQGAEVLDGVAALAAGHVEDEEEELAPDDVPEEFVAEADVEVGAFDEAGDVGNGGAVVAGELDDADDGVEGGEGIGGDLGVGGRDAAEEGGFAGVGVADEAGIGDGAKFEDEVAFLAGLAGGGFARDAVGGTLEMDVAFAAVAAFAEDEFLSGLGEIGDQFEIGAMDIDALLGRGFGRRCLLFKVVEGDAAADGLARRAAAGPWTRYTRVPTGTRTYLGFAPRP